MMLTVFLALALSRQCDYTYDLTQYSGHSQVYMYSGYGYCLRFTGPYGVIHMNKMGYATGDIFYSSSGYYSSPSDYNYDSSIASDFYMLSSPRVISFGLKYGMIYVSTTQCTNVYYTYGYANKTCTQISVSSKNVLTYGFPNGSTIVNRSMTYCFIYMHYGSTFSFVNLSNTSIAYNDRMYWSYGISSGSMDSSWLSFGTVEDPLQAAFVPSDNGHCNEYNAYFSSPNTILERTIEGEFDDLSNISKLYGIGYDAGLPFDSISYLPAPVSSSDSSQSNYPGIIIAISCIIGVIVVVSVLVIILHLNNKHNDASLAVPFAEDAPEYILPSPSSEAILPSMLPLYGMYPSQQNAQFQINVPPYSPNTFQK